jgi:hypothetical protein
VYILSNLTASNDGETLAVLQTLLLKMLMCFVILLEFWVNLARLRARKKDVNGCVTLILQNILQADQFCAAVRYLFA